MTSLNSLSKETLSEVLAKICGLAEEASTAEESPMEDHSDGCHTRQVGCLAESILEVVDEAVMKAAIDRVTACLNADKLRREL